MDGAVLGTAAFYLLASLTVIGAGGVALSSHIVYSALSMMVAFFGVAGLYVMLGGDFVAGVQLLVYVGGVLVLTLFAVMLTQGIRDVRISNRSAGRGAALVLAFAAFALMGRILVAADWPEATSVSAEPSTTSIGEALLTSYLLPFEVASLVLLAVLVGAVVLTRKETAE
jgi:NADH:ubiquinone oxidoreductase subunit 6 (subunit J)